MRAILLIFFIASSQYIFLRLTSTLFTSALKERQKLKKKDGGVGSSFILPWRWENTTFNIQSKQIETDILWNKITKFADE